MTRLLEPITISMLCEEGSPYVQTFLQFLDQQNIAKTVTYAVNGHLGESPASQLGKDTQAENVAQSGNGTEKTSSDDELSNQLFIIMIDQTTSEHSLYEISNIDLSHRLIVLLPGYECHLESLSKLNDEYLFWPCQPNEAELRLKRLCHSYQSLSANKARSAIDLDKPNGPLLREELKNEVMNAAQYTVPVLINGETGTGKEVVAQTIHEMSPRREKPFIPVNCGALPDELIVNELFGHEKGAYTGAAKRHMGLVDQAQGGTLFLDEVDSLSLKAQVVLLRFLQDKQFRMLGGQRSHTADVRILCASNADFDELIESGKFRKDLYYRLNVLHIHLPPLRERKNEIIPLAKEKMDLHCKEHGLSVVQFTEEEIEQLVNYPWPGNIRELENVILRFVIMGELKLFEMAERSTLAIHNRNNHTSNTSSGSYGSAHSSTHVSAHSSASTDNGSIYYSVLDRRNNFRIARDRRANAGIAHESSPLSSANLSSSASNTTNSPSNSPSNSAVNGTINGSSLGSAFGSSLGSSLGSNGNHINGSNFHSSFINGSDPNENAAESDFLTTTVMAHAATPQPEKDDADLTQLELEDRREIDRANVEVDGLSEQAFVIAKAKVVENFEKRFLIELLKKSGGNVTLAARISGKERRAFGKLLKKYGVDREQYAEKKHVRKHPPHSNTQVAESQATTNTSTSTITSTGQH